MAADPQQPKVGGTQVIVATNGYAGTLTVRTQINLGLAPVAAILSVDTNGTIQATSSASGFPSLNLADTNGASGFNLAVGGSPFWGGQSLYLSIGAPAPNLSTNASQAAFLVGIGDSVLGDSTITNSYHLYAIGDYAGNSSTYDGTSDLFEIGTGFGSGAFITSRYLFAMGNSDFYQAHLTNANDVASIGGNFIGASGDTFNKVYALGSGNFHRTLFSNASTSIGAIGVDNFSDSVVINSGALYAAGAGNLENAIITTTPDVGAFGDENLSSSALVNSSYFYAWGDAVMQSLTATNTQHIHGFGDLVLSGAALTNSSQIYAFGYRTGEGLSGDGLTDIILFGSATLPSQNHQMVWNVGATTGMPYVWQVGNTNSICYTATGGIQTSIPSGGTNAVPFKIGEHVAGTFSLVTTNAVLIEINGVTYKLATVQ